MLFPSLRTQRKLMVELTKKLTEKITKQWFLVIHI